MEKKASSMFLAAVGLGMLALAGIEVLFEVHVPGTDVFLFKEAGVNLATQGKFVAANLPHMHFGEERPFAYYPPLYPFFFGVWSWLVGVGLKQSILFDALIRIVRTGLMWFIMGPGMPVGFFDKKNRLFLWVLGLLLCLLSVASTDRDRPDELALVFGLLLLKALASSLNQGVKSVLGALLLACVGATSPACGVFFGLLTLVWGLKSHKPFLNILKVGLFTGAFWTLMIAPVLLQDAASGLRFSQQAGISSFPYLRFLSNPISWTEVWSKFLFFFRIFRATSPHFSYLAIALSILFVFNLFRSHEKKADWRGSSWGLGCILFMGIVPLAWTLQPYYLWFPSIVLVVCTLEKVAKETGRRKMIALSVLGIFLMPFILWEAKCLLNSFQMPFKEKRAHIREIVLAEVNPGANLGITHDQYFTFRGFRPVVNVEYWGANSKLLDYLYVTNLPNSQSVRNPGERLLSSQKDKCFILVKDLSTRTPIKILGISTPFHVRGSGGGLFRNSCKVAHS